MLNLNQQAHQAFEKADTSGDHVVDASEILVHYGIGPAYIGYNSGHRRPVHALERVYRDFPDLSAKSSKK